MKKFIVLVMLISLLGCKTLVSSGDDFNNLIVINNEIKSGNVSTILNSVELTNTEKLIITHSINKFNNFANKWKNIKDLKSTSDDFIIFQAEYLELKSQYFLVENIINKNWALFLPHNQEILQEYKDRAIQADNTFENLKDAGSYVQMVYAAIAFAKIAIGVLK